MSDKPKIDAASQAQAAILTLEGKGYTYHGGQLWRPPLGNKPDFDLLDAAQTTIAHQAQMIEHLRGGATPGFTAIDMGTAASDGRRSLAEYLIKQIAIEHPDQDTLLTVKYIAQWIALETGL